MVQEICPICKLPLKPENGKDNSFHNNYHCSKCKIRYTVPYKGGLMKIGAEPSADFLFLVSLPLHLSCPPILVELFQFRPDNCFAGLGAVPAQNTFFDLLFDLRNFFVVLFNA